jgi:CRP-like cAMP-binding protein
MQVEPSDLQKHSLFGGFLDEQIAGILPLMKIETFDAGSVVITEGRPSDRIYFILEGEVEVSKKGISLASFTEGQFFGEMEVLDVMPAEATITTLKPARLISLSNSGLHELSKKDIKAFAMLIMNLARDLSRHLRDMNLRYTETMGR